MSERTCPLCKQSVSEELYEEITGIWRVRKIQEKELKKQKQDLIKQQREAKKQLTEEKRKLKSEQKAVIDKKIADETKKFSDQLAKVESQKNKIQEQANKKIAIAIKAAERKARLEIQNDLKGQFDISLKKAVEKANSKLVKETRRKDHTIEATRKQMSTLQIQSMKQQDRIKNLETQLKKQTTPQLEGLLYEDQLLKVLQAEFPEDQFSHTGKGGDILQHIMLNKEMAGIMVYECKKVNHWQSAHVEQAATAKLQRKADFAILVTNATKKGSGGFFIEKGVIVVNPGGVLAIVGILRDQILRIAQLKLTKAQKEEAVENTLKYLQGSEFKNSLEVVIRKTIEMYDDLKKECQDHLKIWKKRHESLKSVYINTAQVKTRTAALIAGKTDISKMEITIEPFPALPDLREG